jgi:hypothetical protein
MADSVLDFAGLDAAAGAADASAAAADDSAIDAAESTEGAEGTTDASEAPGDGSTNKATESAEKNADGTSKTEGDKDAKPVDATPQSVRSTLKSLKDADPKNAKIVNELHGSYERWQAAKQIFPKGVAEMKAAKELIDLVGGAEGYEAQQQVVAAIQASDEKIYNGDGSIHDDIIEDLKSEGKLDKYPALVSAGVDKLKEVDQKAYDAMIQPHMFSELTEANLPGAISSLAKVLTLAADAKPEDVLKAVEAAKGVISSMDAWWKSLEKNQKTVQATKADPERQKLEAERQKFQNEQKEFATKQTKEFQEGVAKEAGVVDRQLLGKALNPFFKAPYFKSFTKENWQPLANLIQNDLYETLKADKTYQAQMKSMWAAKSPDKAKILEYRRAKVEGLAGDIVRRSVQKMYPEYAKGGAAAGRIAAATAKKAAEDKTNKEQAATGKPVYVAQKPAWDAIDFDKDPKQYLYTAGKAYLKGSGRLVTWRK